MLGPTSMTCMICRIDMIGRIDTMCYASDQQNPSDFVRKGYINREYEYIVT